MHGKELSQNEYAKTFLPPMLDVTSEADEIVDLWAYADPIVLGAFPFAGDWEWHVKHIYESEDGTYQHLNIPVPLDDTYLVVIVNKPEKRIIGHVTLDLSAKHPG
jgi:hypothetical protein